MLIKEVMSLEAGPELDKLIAEQILGWYALEQDKGCIMLPGATPLWRGHHPRKGPIILGDKQAIPGYSTSVLAAYEIVEYLLEKNPHACINSKRYGLEPYSYEFEAQTLDECNRRWFCAFMKSPGIRCSGDGYAWGPTLPLAICRAALTTLTEQD